jgi:hypothetical protein
MNEKLVKKLLTKIRELAGEKIFSVRFIKRTTGQAREMLCRFGVKKGQTGEGLAFEPLDHGLLTVYDMEKHGFRMIPVDSIEWIRIRGTTYDGKGREAE